MRVSFFCAAVPLILAVALVAFSGVSLAAAEAKHIAGTPVSLLPPAGFTPSNLVPGYDLLSSGSSIYVTEVPDAAFQQLESLKDPSTITAQFEKFGVATTAMSETIVIASRPYTLLSAQIDVGGTQADIWMAVTGPNPSVIVTFQQLHIPGLTTALDREAVLAVLESVTLGAPTSFEEQLITTGLTLQPKPPFTVAREVFAGRAIALSTLKDRSKDHSAPLVLVLVLPIRSEKASLVTLADHYARDEDGPISDTLSKPVQFVGEDGLRLEGKRTSTDGTAEHFVVYVAIVSNRAIALIGAGRETDMTNAVITSIDEIAASVQQQADPSNTVGDTQ